MNNDIKNELINIYKDGIQIPFFGGIKNWAENNIILPPAYAIPGKLNLSISPYLLQPLIDIDNPTIMQINLAMATQVGKSLIAELCIPYWIMNNPGPIFRIFHNKEVSDVFTETRLIPLLKNCKTIAPLLTSDRFSMKKGGIILPHMAITMGSAGTALQHGMSVKYLLCDELHQFDAGCFNKFLARTTAFAGRRKIICSSQPSLCGSEWDQINSKGRMYEWQWLCPQCKTRQPFHWSKEKKDGTYGGMNWDTILNSNETTNIFNSAKTAWLECIHCDCRIHDTPEERHYLNNTGEYVCVKQDGDHSIVSYTCPNFVNVNLSFEYAVTQYLMAKQMKKQTGLDEQLEIFVTQILGKFYKKEDQTDVSKIMTEIYDKESINKDWTNILSVDVQRNGNVKYWLVRSWHKNGNESRRIDFGVAREWEEIESIRKKYNVVYPMVGIDSGDGQRTQEIYQECIKHGQVIKINNNLQYICWTPLKGDQKVSYKHPDAINRLYSPVSNQDSNFPVSHKLKGIPAPLILWSNYSIKTILANLRDNKIKGIKWVVDRQDEEYDKQMYSEDLVEVIDKKSGVATQRWIQSNTDNHWLDVEAMNLLQAVRANLFSATKIDENQIKKIIEDKEKYTKEQQEHQKNYKAIHNPNL